MSEPATYRAPGSSLNGKFRASRRNPYEVIELRPRELPVMENDDCTDAFQREVAGPLGLERSSEEYVKAWTVYRRAWRTRWFRSLEQGRQ